MADTQCSHSNDIRANHVSVFTENISRSPLLDNKLMNLGIVRNKRKRRRLSRLLDRLAIQVTGSSPSSQQFDEVHLTHNNNNTKETKCYATGTDFTPCHQVSSLRLQSNENLDLDKPTKVLNYKTEVVGDKEDPVQFGNVSSSSEDDKIMEIKEIVDESDAFVRVNHCRMTPMQQTSHVDNKLTCLPMVGSVGMDHSHDRLCICVNCNSARTNFFPQHREYLFPSSPVSPLTPDSLPPYNFENYFNFKYLPNYFGRRIHSDPDVTEWSNPPKTDTIVGSCNNHGELSVKQESAEDLSSSARISGGYLPTVAHSQEIPLDLSIKRNQNSRIISNADSISMPYLSPLQIFPLGFLHTQGNVSVPIVKGDVASPTTKETVASRYNLEVSPVVEEMPPGSDVAYVCPVCGQMFSLHDRLAKHMASRHKSRLPNAESGSKAYTCDVCNRSFARSDMLTRHMRLHTGVKPYNCKVCSQVFSRSDHLSTHQRTHTGEKPYKCPQCPYAACRRDMITRHMRTHTRLDLNTTEPPTELPTAE